MPLRDVVKYGDPLLIQPTQVVTVFDASVAQLAVRTSAR